MAFYDMFEQLCKEKGVTPTQAGRDNGIAQGVVSMWKKRGSIPKAETIQKLADYFCVTPRALTGTDPIELRPEHTKVLDELDEEIAALRAHLYDCDEAKMLQAYQRLNRLGKQKAAERVEELTEIPRYRAPAAPESPPGPSERQSSTPATDAPQRPTEGE